MIQRRAVGLDPPTPSVTTNHQNGNGTAKPVRKRHVRRTGMSRKNSHWLKGLSSLLADEDSIIALIQMTSIIIIIGCFIALILHFFAGEIVLGENEASDLTWRTSFLVQMNRWFLGRDILKLELHRDHENSGRKNRKKDGTVFEVLPPSSIYTIPGSMPHIGDKSDAYARLRKEYDAMDLPKVEQRYKFKTMPMETDKNGEAETPKHLPAPYDIHNCPEHPPENYPYAWNLLQILDHWNPDNVEIPEDLTIFQGICVFDFETESEKALNYRNAEVPFLVANDPAVQEVADRWMSPGYLERLIGDVKHRTEYSETNHFMYWNAGANMRKLQRKHAKFERWNNDFRGDNHPDGRGVSTDLAHWQQPTSMMRITYSEWLSHANLTEGETVGPNDPHYYFRLIGCGEQNPLGGCDKGSSEYLFDELQFLQPKENLYMVDPKEQKGIHCRFGMSGVIAENHFDQSRNAIALFGGERRYILSHPNQCPFLSLLPMGHPSARHSAVDWTNPDLETYPEFAQAEANELVLQAGDVLYLPTNWLHFIQSLNLNWQCNSRSGTTPEYFKPMRKCGF